MRSAEMAGFATKKRIFDALYSLAKEQPWKNIKVSDICNRANVSRATFYHHFNSKYDIAVWHSDMILAAGLDEIGVTLTWFEGHLITTRGISCFYDFYAVCESPETNGKLFQSHHAMHRKAVMERTVTQVKRLDLTPKLAFQINALANCEEWAIRDWYKGNMKADLKEICEFMISIVPRDLYHVLEKPEYPSGMGGQVYFRDLFAKNDTLC